MLKHGMSQCPDFKLSEIFSLLRDLSVASGFFCYGLSTLLYFKVLASLELSIAYPTVSFGYVLVIALSKVIFKERVSKARWGAVVVICIGVVLVGLSSH